MRQNPAVSFLKNRRERRNRIPAPAPEPEPTGPIWDIRVQFESEARGATDSTVVVVCLQGKEDITEIIKRRTFDFVEDALEYLNELDEHPDNECNELTRKTLTDQMET